MNPMFPAAAVLTIGACTGWWLVRWQGGRRWTAMQRTGWTTLLLGVAAMLAATLFGSAGGYAWTAGYWLGGCAAVTGLLLASAVPDDTGTSS